MPISGQLYMWEERAKYVPEDAGVYAFYSEDRNLIYLGGSSNLRKTFTQYLETKFSEDPRKLRTVYYRRECAPEWQERLRELLDEYSQEHGETPKLNNSVIEPTKKEISGEHGFNFYEDVGKPLSETAFSLQDFWDKLRKIPVSSLEFHQGRGDFARWIRDVFKETELAERIEKIFDVGEDLRRELLKAEHNSECAECPQCGTSTIQAKTWKMAGRPSKTGERLQLTIGLYKCNNCKKTFRNVIKKEKII